MLFADVATGKGAIVLSAAKQFLALTLVTALVLALSIGFFASQAWAAQDVQAASGSPLKVQDSKVYPSKKAAKKAVIAQVKAKWRKSKPKVKVEAAAKKNMNALQKQTYKKYKKRAGKNAKKYKFYIVTFASPRFTVSAKYKDGKGQIKKYSFTAAGRGGWSSISYPTSYRKVVHAFLDEGLNDGSIPSWKSWGLYAVKKGARTLRFTCSAEEEHDKLTGEGSNGDFGYVPNRRLTSAPRVFKLKG